MHEGVYAARQRSANIPPKILRGFLHQGDHSSRAARAVDLLIRTGGERRLSDFILWKVAHAELHFTHCPCPDLDGLCFQCARNIAPGVNGATGARHPAALEIQDRAWLQMKSIGLGRHIGARGWFKFYLP